MSAPVESRQLLCLTMMGYMKEGISEEELCQFQVNQHSRLVCGLMEKYGVLRYEVVRASQFSRHDVFALHSLS